MFKGANIMNDKKMINPFKVAQQLSEQGYTHVTMVVGSDRVQEFKKGIGKYVGTDGYNFKFDVVSAGNRDPDAEGVVGMSGSKMRQAVKDNDLSSCPYIWCEIGLLTRTIQSNQKRNGT